MPPITSYFSVATPEQAAEQASRGFEQIRHHIRWEKAHKISDDAAKAQHIRESANERQQRRRLRLKQSEAHLGLRDRETLRKVKPMKLQSPPLDSPGTPAPVNVDPAAKAVPVKRRRAPRTNWYEPTRWTLIATAAKRVGFSSPQGIVHQLQVGANGELFKTLDRGTVAAWINDKRTGWTQAVLDRVARVADGEAPRVVNPEQPLGRRPFLIISLIASIVLLLTNMRNAGTIITMAVAQSVVLAFIRQEAPELLDNPKFKCSRKFVRRILADKLDWSWRAVTQAAQKLPDDWEQQCLDFAHRLTWNITMNKIPPELVINADQTGVSYLGTGARTWELKGSSQVSAVGQGEKRQFTLMVAATAAGKLLPFQAIYKGKTSNSLPSKAARDTCEHAQFLFTPGGEKHWSNLETMKVWVNECLVKYVNSERLRLGLSLLQKVILILDCWAVHRGSPFQTWMRQTHPTIIILFVPGNCTCVAQPCDTRINRILKHLIKSACIEYLAELTQEQLRNGIAPADVVINTQPGTLRDASTAWLLKAWNWFQDRPEVVLGAWRDTKFGGWDLSYETLTSPKSCAIVYERFMEDREFCLSISSQAPSDPNFKEAESPDFDDDYAIDPSLLCDIRPGVLPPDVVERDGQLDYVGDQDLE